MAVTKVVANLARDSTELVNTHGDTYVGSLKAPKEDGTYSVEILAYDENGNVAIANSSNMEGLAIIISKWKTPKTNWLPTDRFNFVDYNRIKNNLICLHELAVELYKQFDIEDMGEDITSYEVYWDSEQFNLFEENLETINNNVMIQDFGDSQTFYPNGIFIKYDELNRIEGAILSMKLLLDSQMAGKKRLSFRLGAFKEVKI